MGLATRENTIQIREGTSSLDSGVGKCDISHYTNYYEVLGKHDFNKKIVEEVQIARNLVLDGSLNSNVLFGLGAIGMITGGSLYYQYPGTPNYFIVLGGLMSCFGAEILAKCLLSPFRLKKLREGYPHDYRVALENTEISRAHNTFISDPANFSVKRPYDLKEIGWRYSHLTDLRDKHHDRIRRISGGIQKLEDSGQLKVRSVRRADELIRMSRNVLDSTRREYDNLEKIMTFESLGGYPEDREGRNFASDNLVVAGSD